MAVGAEAVSHTRAMIVLRYLDVVAVLVLAAPIIAIGAPVLGYAVGAGGWILARVLQANADLLNNRFSDPRSQVTANLFQGFGRVWLCAAAIVIAGVAGQRRDGLTAALVIFCAYTIAFAIRALSGPPAGRTPR